MEKSVIGLGESPASGPSNHQLGQSRGIARWCFLAVFSLLAFHNWRHWQFDLPGPFESDEKASPYGVFPRVKDGFHFLPCTNLTVPPVLDDPNAIKSWAALFDPNPAHWSWSTEKLDQNVRGCSDSHAGHGIYLCGWIDVPLDYTNTSDNRIARLAVTKLQVSGLDTFSQLTSSSEQSRHSTKRTIVIEPGGPGGSGTSYTWRGAQEITARLSNSTYDVLGWDPRGVNISQPAISCQPHDADLDRYSFITGRYRAEVGNETEYQLRLADAYGDATFKACWDKYGDVGRFMGTAFVARDLEEIRKVLKEDELTAYMVSYGTGIGQTYAAMFPDSVGRMILDGTEYVRDHRLTGGFGWTALDNGTDAWHDGFLGECINAGPEHCALAKPPPSADMQRVTLQSLEERMTTLIDSLATRPLGGYTVQNGPSLITHGGLVALLYGTMYNAFTWPIVAQGLYDLEQGNTTLISELLEPIWQFDPTKPYNPATARQSTEHMGYFVICADSYDDATPENEWEWWSSLWANMTTRSWIAGNSRFSNVFPCKNFHKYWPTPAEVYRGDLNHTLKHPVLLIAETHDPATPLRNGRRLLAEMGQRNARLIAHHGYGHSSRDRSACTDGIARRFIMEGVLPDEAETACFADGKPYLYDAAVVLKSAGYGEGVVGSEVRSEPEPEAGIEIFRHIWREHLEDLRLMHPLLGRGT